MSVKSFRIDAAVLVIDGDGFEFFAFMESIKFYQLYTFWQNNFSKARTSFECPISNFLNGVGYDYRFQVYTIKKKIAGYTL